ncbi:MAG: enoyl-CoA hydratase/isomerase family protein, partial [Chloroflexota bacterium]
MNFETLLVEKDGPIGHLTLNRPKRMNALGATVLQELTAAARWFDEQREIRVVIVRGEGRAFCAGADLNEPFGQVGDDATWLDRREQGQLGLQMANAIEGMRAVTIAQVHGYAVGGGIVLMSACDLRVVAEETVFSIPEVDLGIPLAWGGIPRLVREIGPAITKELVMTCRRFTPQEAQVMRFVNRVVPLDQLGETCEALAQELADKPFVPLVITKEHVNSVTQAMGSGSTAFADGDTLLGV